MQDLKAIRFIEGTKVSHDYEGDAVTTFSYRDLWARNIPAIGIPCKQNSIIVVDVDVIGPTHQKDGREFWDNFSKEFGIPKTYTVRSPSGGFHYYFKLPESVNPESFHAPKCLADGVDIKWNGWVGAPPTPGYTVHWGDLTMMQYAPPALMAELHNRINARPSMTFDQSDPSKNILNVHNPFSQAQLAELNNNLTWIQQNAALSREEWLNGLFALKAGIEDPALLDDMACKWSMNKAYMPGDEDEARRIIARADAHGAVGPGTIISIMNDIKIREEAPIKESPFTIQEILDKSRVSKHLSKNGTLVVEPSETNAASLIGAIFNEEDLHHDVRSGHYMYRGRSHSDTELTNIFLPMIQSPSYGLGFEKFRKTTVTAGIDVLMAMRQKDPHIEYLKSLQWDGVSRIENFFKTYMGVQDSEYYRLIGKNFWTALAARGLKPGIKFDTMLVLEGKQGIAKSSFIEAIAGQYTFCPSNPKCLTDLDDLRQMHQSIITELPELVGLIGQRDEYVKNFLAKPFDNIRALFSKRATRNERGFLLVGTTNNQRYLSVAMGARRFWPVEIPDGQSIDIMGIKTDRDQLFAEGIQSYKFGHRFWYVPNNLLDPIIDSKVIEEPLIGPIEEIAAASGDKFSYADVYRRLEAGGYINRGLSQYMVGRIEQSLARLKYRKGSDGRWSHPAYTDAISKLAQVMYHHAEEQNTLESFI